MTRVTQSIRLVIMLAAGSCLLLVFAIGGTAITGLSSLNEHLGESKESRTAPALSISELRASQVALIFSLRQAELAQDALMAQASIESIRSAILRMEKAWKRYDVANANDKERVIGGEIQTLLRNSDVMLDRLTAALDEKDLSSIARTATDAITPVAKLSALLDDLNDRIESRAEASHDNGKAAFRIARSVIVGLIAICVLTAIVLAGWLHRVITGPLETAVAIADAIAAGKLGNAITAVPRNELGRLLESLQKMDRHLSETVRGIQMSSLVLATTSREIASGNADLSDRTTRQATSLERTAASMTQLTNTVKQNAIHARKARESAIVANGIAEDGEQAVRQMIAVIERISGSSSEISAITSVIEDIAFQTNILALNAAVEAARAGEQGRSFAVVAGEVRSLAQRSAAAAREIKELIGSSVSLIQDGAGQAQETGSTISRVRESIQTVSLVVGEIAAASAEQSHGIEQVNGAVSQMDEVTQQNAALVEQAAAAAQSLEEQAKNLNASVSIFRLNSASSCG